MNDEKGILQRSSPRSKPFIIDLMRNFGAIFTLSILAISFVGLLVVRYAPDAQDISSLFASGGMGLSFNAVLQIAGFSLILAFLSIVVVSDRFIKKMRFLARTILLFLAALFTFSMFAIVFKWFPIEDPLAWLGFVLSTFVCFLFSLGLTLLKLKLEGRKYDRLLANYKARHNVSV